MYLEYYSIKRFFFFFIWGKFCHFFDFVWVVLKRVFRFCFNKDSGKNGGLVAWWDRFRFGCKILKGVF
ncbi:hypothetical protein HPG27_1188 [Helicobacter pylori G27]|uniref:Uncharacterized protein n=1 Tax=Helicobacter pylori (strain G27) TaxID=563041 RepID=B5Z8N9_HELPG|nr:hypothetical protein HPG27_1188 [Helicobacter pylori G27]